MNGIRRWCDQKLKIMIVKREEVLNATPIGTIC
jgi:hypothetical protein